MSEPEPQPSEDERIARARVIYEAMHDAELARTPLAAMPEWVASGAPPPTEALRRQGFRADCPDPEIDRRLRMARKAFVRRWGFAIPCAEAVAALTELGPLVEIGAGAGCWTALLRAAGHDVIATDVRTEGRLIYGFTAASATEVLPYSGAAAVAAYPERDVFCSWPSEGGDWAFAAAQALVVGRAFALIGEPSGGLTATPDLYEFLNACCELETQVEIPQFPNVHDRLTVHRRVR